MIELEEQIRIRRILIRDSQEYTQHLQKQLNELVKEYEEENQKEI